MLLDDRFADDSPTRRQRVLYALGFWALGLGLLAAAGAFGALEWAAARGHGTATGDLHVDRCEMRPAPRSGQMRVCLGTFREHGTGTVDDQAEANSKGAQEGQSFVVTRTLIGDYIEHDDDRASGAAVRMLLFGAVGIGSITGGVRQALRALES
ncbi:hypothetical protein AB0467_01880 [Streptomyces sp. NPDC052095]|uniref:hypothetical protein n=1 Tax=unclassified Streptomyces TaxID=2593676 RepID=UPI00344CC41B